MARRLGVGSALRVWPTPASGAWSTRDGATYDVVISRVGADFVEVVTGQDRTLLVALAGIVRWWRPGVEVLEVTGLEVMWLEVVGLEVRRLAGNGHACPLRGPGAPRPDAAELRSSTLGRIDVVRRGAHPRRGARPLRVSGAFISSFIAFLEDVPS